MSLLGKQSGPKLFVRLSKVSALEHVRFSQVLLYKKERLGCITVAKYN